MVRLLRLVVLSVAAAASLATTAGVRGASSLTNVSVPAKGAYLGAYVSYGPGWPGRVGALAPVTRFERQIRRPLEIDNRFYGWTESFPTPLERADVASGRIPMVTWKAPPLGAVLDGSQDALILRRARAVRLFGAPVFIRWAWEMNGDWARWAGVNNETDGRHDGSRKFVRAWRRVHDLFDRAGATNVSWVWAPNARSVPARPWNTIASYYPGDAYVDWIGFSAYNWGPTRSWSHWSSFASLVSGMYDRWARRKPLMVAETSSVGTPAQKARWLAQAGRALDARFPLLKAVVLFEAPPRWTLTPPEALLELRALAHSPALAARDAAG